MIKNMTPLFRYAALGAFLFTSTTFAQEVELSLPAYVDAAKVAPYTEVGESVVRKGKFGKYREVGSNRLDRIAYLFETESIGDLVKLTIEYPDDGDRLCELYLFSEDYIDHSSVLNAAGAGINAFGSSYITGQTLPVSHELKTDTFYFHVPRSRKFAICLMTGLKDAPAAVKSLSLERVEDWKMPDWPAEMSTPDRRRLGIYWEDPVLVSNFGEPQPPTRPQFLSALDRMVNYMKHTGHREIIYPVVWYQAALYQPSAEFQIVSWYKRPHPGDYDRLIADRFSEEGLAFWPSIRNWTMPSIVEHMGSLEDIRSGKLGTSYINAINTEGGMNTREKRWHLPAEVNGFHPIVQTAFKNLVREIMGRIGDEPSVPGLALWTTKHSMHGLGSVDQSYDDYTLNLFSRTTGIALPELKGAYKDRFQQWHNWLREEHWETWLQWRRDHQTAYYNELAEIVTSYNPEAKLNIIVFMPQSNQPIEDVGSHLEEAGLDLPALEKNPSILITRLKKTYKYYSRVRELGVDHPESLFLKQAENTTFDAEWQAPFVETAKGVSIQYSYLEKQIANSPMLEFPEDWAGYEPRWHVSHPRGSGRNALESLARSLALHDTHFLDHGGFSLGPQGLEDLAPSWAAGFNSLPAVDFKTQYDADGVVLRSQEYKGKTWLYLVNATPLEKDLSIVVSGEAALSPVALESDQRPQLTGKSKIKLRPFDLLVWKSPLETSVEIESVSEK